MAAKGPRPETIAKFEATKVLIASGKSVKDALEESGLNKASYQVMKRAELGIEPRKHLPKEYIDLPMHTQPTQSEKVTVIVCNPNQIKSVMENLR